MMGWDQDVCRNSVRDFLLELMEIDTGQLVSDALQAKMGEVGLTHEEEEVEGREEGDGLVNVFTPKVLRLSDGRVFIETLVESTCGDSWGSDFYSFVEVGKPFEFTRNDHIYDGEDDFGARVVTTKEERISTYNLPGPNIPEQENNLPEPENNLPTPEIQWANPKSFTPDEVRERGGEFSGAVADWMEEQGLDHIALPYNDDAPTPDQLRKMAGEED
jgi:hypothetical protein